MNRFWKIISIWIIIVWMFTIYYLSGMPRDESNSKSKALIQSVVGKAESNKTNEVKEEIEKDNNLIEQLVEKINKPIRKVVHATVYLVLALLIGIVYIVFEIEGKKFVYISILIPY